MSQSELPFEPEALPQNFAEAPAPGMHADVPWEDYFSWRAVNSGVIRWGAISPKHFDAALNGRIKSDDTRSRKLGRAIHCMVLEPDAFHKRFIVGGSCIGTIGSGDRKGQPCGNTGLIFDGSGWYCGMHSKGHEAKTGDKEVITQDEFDRCLKLKESLKNSVANIGLRRAGYSEMSIVWDYKGLAVKGRLDRYADGKRPLILDVKKCRIGYGTIEECERSVLNYQYHVQAAIYVEGVERLTGRRPEFVWIFVEDNEPFAEQVLPASEQVLKIGWHIARESMNRYLRCVKENKLPGYIWYPENIHPGGLPSWEIKKALQAGWLNEGGDDDNGSGEGDGWGIDPAEADDGSSGAGDEETVGDHSAVAGGG